MNIFLKIPSWFKVFSKWFIENGWPWFVEKIWPVIKERVIEISQIIFSFLEERIKSILDQYGKKQEEEMKKKAREAEKKAEKTSNATEAEKYQAVAGVWREVAEMFRRENENLKEEIDQIVKESGIRFNEKLERIDVDEIFMIEKEGTIKIKDTDTKILQPSSTAKKILDN